MVFGKPPHDRDLRDRTRDLTPLPDQGGQDKRKAQLRREVADLSRKLERARRDLDQAYTALEKAGEKAREMRATIRDQAEQITDLTQQLASANGGVELIEHAADLRAFVRDVAENTNEPGFDHHRAEQLVTRWRPPPG